MRAFSFSSWACFGLVCICRERIDGPVSLLSWTMKIFLEIVSVVEQKGRNGKGTYNTCIGLHVAIAPVFHPQHKQRSPSPLPHTTPNQSCLPNPHTHGTIRRLHHPHPPQPQTQTPPPPSNPPLPGNSLPPQTVFAPDRPAYPRFVNRFNPREILLAVDGSCLNNGRHASKSTPPLAACAFLFKAVPSHHLERRGPAGDAVEHTSNRAKLRAVVAALQFRPWDAEGWRRVVVLRIWSIWCWGRRGGWGGGWAGGG